MSTGFGTVIGDLTLRSFVEISRGKDYNRDAAIAELRKEAKVALKAVVDQAEGMRMVPKAWAEKAIQMECYEAAQRAWQTVKSEEVGG